MRVEKTATGLIIHAPTNDVKRKCLQFFSLTNPVREYFIYSGNDINKKPIFGKEHDVIYIPSGFGTIRDPVIHDMMRHVDKVSPPVGKKIDLTLERQPRSKLQEDCIKTLTTSTSPKITVELKPGTGKMEPYSRKIPTPTPSGYSFMGELKVGDYVFDRHGKQTKILEIFDHDEQDVYKVTFEDGRTAFCGKDHLWTIMSHKDDYAEKTVSTGDLIKELKHAVVYVPICDEVQYTNEKMLFTPDLLRETLFNSFTQGHELLRYVLRLSPACKKRFIEAISYESKLIVVNRKYHKELKKILWSLGYMCTASDDSIFYYKTDKLQIKKVEFSHREKCRCIMVDNEEHLYLTENYIVTHNTFIALYAISKIGLKPLIIAPTTLLKNQWIENFVDEGIPENDIAKNIYDAPNKKLCVVTISAIENELREDWEGLMNVISKSQFGIKIIDESHLHLKGVLRLDSICNIKHNWYLSATLGRSSEEEDNILNRALLDADRFVGNVLYEEYQKEYVEIYFQDIWYNPSMKLCDETFKFGTKGLVRSTYYNMLMRYKGGIPFKSNVIHMIKIAKSIVKDDEKKIVILLPMINIIEEIMDMMKSDRYFDKYRVVSVDGSMPLSVRHEKLDNGNIIFSTSQSMGTGVDVANLIGVINFDQYASPIIIEQSVGRLRDRGWKCFYFDICDHVKYAKSITNWGRKRRMVMPYFPGVSGDIKKLPNKFC